jgi:N-acetylglucosamine-6-phosphate deacetylase
MSRTVFVGARLVLPDRLVTDHALVVEDGLIRDIVPGQPPEAAGADVIDATGRTLVPGFIDVHVHGTTGHDVLDGPGAVARVAADLPRYGVTAFCPTTVACSPSVLEAVLAEVDLLRSGPSGSGARVLGAHLESNFLNAAFRGAQPDEWLRLPEAGADIMAVISRHRDAVAVVTMAPEIPDAHALMHTLRGDGIAVSLGHSGATLDEARAAFRDGATRVTHLFNRMPPLAHREPGLAGAALLDQAIFVEIIADGVHVHPGMLRLVWALKGAGRVAAITDGTAGSGLPRGSRTRLGDRPVVVDDVARLDDGTMAGSVATMAQVFRQWVDEVKVPLTDAATMCAGTPAQSIGRTDLGRLAPGAPADLVLLDPALEVTETWVAGRRVFPA